MLAIVLAASHAAAAPVFIGVSTTGLEPPPGFVARDDAFWKGAASITALGMSAEAYARASADRPHLAVGTAGPDAKIDRFSVGGADGFIVRGRRTVGGADVRVWLVVVGTPRQSAMVGVFVPVADTQITDAAIEGALKTIAFRDTPGLAAQMAALRFRVGVMAGFRAVAASALTRTLELDDEAKGTPAHVIVRAEPSGFPGGDTLARRFAEQFLWAHYRVRPLQAPRLYAADGGHYAELRAETTEGVSHAVTDIAFFVRYDESGAFDIACSAPHPIAATVVERCRSLARSVRPRV